MASIPFPKFGDEADDRLVQKSPQNIEAEQGVLGSILREPSTLGAIRQILRGPDDFFREVHSVLYQVILDLDVAGIPIDSIALIDAVTSRFVYTNVDLDDLLSDVIDSIPHAGNGTYYAQIVKEKAIAREVIEHSQEVIRKGLSNELSAEDLVAFSQSSAGLGESPTWDQPDPHDAAMPFPLQILPAALVELIQQASETFPCPPDFIAVSALAAASVAIGRSVAIAAKPSWVESASLYLGFCAPPGSIKSDAMRLAMRPIVLIQRKALGAHRVLRNEAAQRKKEAKAKTNKRLLGGKNAQEGADDEIPPPERILVGDTTCEKLAVLFEQSPRGLIQVFDELTAWVGGMNQYKSGGTDRQFYLSAWSGSTITIDRKSQEGGIPSFVFNPFLTVCGAITPEKLGVLRGDGLDDGFPDRILVSYPDCVKVRFTAQSLDERRFEDWCDAIERLHERSMVVDEEGDSRPFIVKFTPKAFERFGQWFDSLEEEREQADFPAYLRGPWAKLRGYCCRLALILESLHWAYDPMGSDTPANVSLTTLERAITLVEYFKSHTRRVQRTIRSPQVDNPDGLAILEWASNRDSERITKREIRDNFRRRFAANPNGLDEAIAWLVGRNCLRRLTPSSVLRAGRKVAEAYEIHPSLLKKRAQNAQNSLK